MKEEPPAKKQHLGSKLHILLVEDDPIIQYLHTNMLLELGCKVDTAIRGWDAIHQADAHDLVFVDISLPDINGYEVIKAIRRRSKTIPLIALTVETGEKEKLACLQVGANEFVSKPISLAQLKNLLDRFCAHADND